MAPHDPIYGAYLLNKGVFFCENQKNYRIRVKCSVPCWFAVRLQGQRYSN